MAPDTKNNTSHHLQTFQNFFQGWLARQENYLHQLLHSLDTVSTTPAAAENDPRLAELINRVMAHYNEYYEAKSRVAHADVFLVFAPPWFSPFERTFLWVAGFKPGLAFRLATNFVPDMSQDQTERLERLLEETRAEEKELEEELATIQEGLAAKPMVVAARRATSGEIEAARVEMDEAVGKLGSAMESAVGCGDMLRSKTVMKVMEILNMGQKVRFMAAVAQFQLRIRNWGMHRDAAESRIV